MMNQIRALAHRFVSLPPVVRMQLSKRLLELYGSEQAAREAERRDDSCGPLLRKSFLEQFWDEVEEAHGDHRGAINPFTEERRSIARKPKGAARGDERGGCLPCRPEQSKLLALL